MQNAYVVTGYLVDERTVALDEGLPLLPAKVRLVVEPLANAGMANGDTKPSGLRQQTLTEIRARQQARGFVPPSAAAVASHLQAERDSWD